MKWIRIAENHTAKRRAAEGEVRMSQNELCGAEASQKDRKYLDSITQKHSFPHSKLSSNVIARRQLR
jgi:hypothetical protein